MQEDIIALRRSLYRIDKLTPQQRNAFFGFFAPTYAAILILIAAVGAIPSPFAQDTVIIWGFILTIVWLPLFFYADQQLRNGDYDTVNWIRWPLLAISLLMVAAFLLLKPSPGLQNWFQPFVYFFGLWTLVRMSQLRIMPWNSIPGHDHHFHV